MALRTDGPLEADWAVVVRPRGRAQGYALPCNGSLRLETLGERGILKPRHGRLKILANGELSKSLTVFTHRISASARQKIEAAGGKVEIL